MVAVMGSIRNMSAGLDLARVEVRCAACRLVLGELASTDGGATVETSAAWASATEPKRSRPHVGLERHAPGPLASATVTWSHKCRDRSGRMVRIARRLDALGLAFSNAARSGGDLFVEA